MREKIFLMAFILVGLLVSAQGRRKDQQAVNIEYGFLPSKGDLKSGYAVKGGYSKVFGDKGFLGKAEAFYQDYEVGYLDNQTLPYQKYGASVMAGYSYEGLAPVFFNVYAGVFGAYEKANNGNQNDPLYNAEIPQKVDGLVYGLTGSAEVEVMLTRKISLVGNYSQWYDVKSKFSKSQFGIFGGLKFYLN